jgi:hypothetical protein
LALPPINTTDETFIREVDEELRRDEIMGFWKRWGRWLVAGAITVMAAFGGWIWWQDYQAKQAGAFGETFDAALKDASEGRSDAAAKSLDALKADSTDGYRASALLTKAALALEKRDIRGAAAIYGEVAKDESLPQPWRDLALVRQTVTEFDQIKPEQVVARLRPLAVKGNPWFGSAGELVAMAYLKMGKRDLAGRIFADMAKDEGVPESIRSRAVQMAGALGFDAVDAANEVTTQ